MRLNCLVGSSHSGGVWTRFSPFQDPLAGVAADALIRQAAIDAVRTSAFDTLDSLAGGIETRHARN